MHGPLRGGHALHGDHSFLAARGRSEAHRTLDVAQRLGPPRDPELKEASIQPRPAGEPAQMCAIRRVWDMAVHESASNR